MTHFTFSLHLMCFILILCAQLSFIFNNAYVFISLKIIIINIGNIEKKKLTSDTQLTFICFLINVFQWLSSLYEYNSWKYIP